MNESTTSIPSDAMRRSRATLRWLVTVALLLSALMIAVDFLQKPFLPEPLQQFERDRFASTSLLGGVLVLCYGVPLLIFSLVVYVALWCGWHSGRRLYTISLALSIPLCLMLGPQVESALLYTLDGAVWVVTGLILGLLYFSDLRAFYESPKSA